jgi:hypothetical protein
MKKLIASLVLMSAAVWGQQTQVLTALTPSPVQNVSVYTTGSTGQTFYCYWVVAVYNGGMGPASQPNCIYNSNSTLSGSNYNSVCTTASGLNYTIEWQDN